MTHNNKKFKVGDVVVFKNEPQHIYYIKDFLRKYKVPLDVKLFEVTDVKVLTAPSCVHIVPYDKKYKFSEPLGTLMERLELSWVHKLDLL